MTVKSLVYISIFTALMCIFAWITIPLPMVSFTLQILGVFLAIFLLKPKNAVISISLYVLLGMIGLPVFSNFNSGIGALVGPTGGYILGFILMALLTFIIKNKIICSLVGLVVCYAFGTMWFMLFSGKDASLWQVLMWCVIPFIIPDLVKFAIALVVSKALKKLDENYDGIDDLEVEE